MQSVVEAIPITPSVSLPPKPTDERYLALDAFRGFVMLMLVSGGFGLHALAQNPSFERVASWFEHVAWEGAVFWDLIQPAFLFMVGAAMPFALAKRVQPASHVFARSLRLVLLSQILMCVSANRLHFQLINVLSQMAFTYLFCYLILRLDFRKQVAAAGLLLAFHTALFFLFPGPDGAFSKTDNIGAVIDRWWLGRTYSGYYVTISFISSIVSTLFGAWAANLIRSERPKMEKLKILWVAMVASFAGGLLLALWIPNVKRLWTASFTLHSTGWVLAMLIGFYWLIDVQGHRKWTFPLIVVGMNSIFIYSLTQVLQGGISRSLGVFTGRFEWIGVMAPVAQATATLLVMWYLCYWLYQRKIFFKL
jgi:predicted acyltransferase